MSDQLLLGLDVGTTGVKAVLVRRATCSPLREARRDNADRHPHPGWVEQDGEDVLEAAVESVAEVLDGRARGDRRLRARPSGRVGDRMGRGERLAAVAERRVAGQALEGGARAHGATSEEEIRARSGLPFDPYFSAGKLAWMLEHDGAVQAAREAGTLRMGTVDSFLCDRLGAGFATDPSTASRTQLLALGAPGFDAWLCRRFGVPAGSAAAR